MNCLINKVGKIGKIKKWCIGFICCFLITASLEVLFNIHSILEGYEAVSVLSSMKERNDFGINIYKLELEEPIYIKSISIMGDFKKSGTYTLLLNEQNMFGKEIESQEVDDFNAAYQIASTNINKKISSLEIQIGEDQGAEIQDIIISNSFEVNKYRCLLSFVFCVLFLLILFVPSMLKEKIAVFYVITSLSVGCLMILFAGGRYVAWDEEIHFSSVYKLASDYTVNWNKAAYMVATKNVPDSNTKLEAAEIRNYLNSEGCNWEKVEDKESLFVEYAKRPFIFMAVFYQLGKILNLPFIYVYMLGKLGNLLFTTLLIYIAIKIATRKKTFIAAIGMMPTVIFLNSTYTYDGTIIASLILGFVLWMNEMESDRKVDIKNLIFIIVLFVWGSFSKAVYIPVILLLLIIPADKFCISRKKVVLFKIGVVGVFLLLMGTFVLPAISNTVSGNLSYGGDSRGGDTSTVRQLISLLSHPVSAMKLFFANIFSFENMGNRESILVDNNEMVTNLLFLNLSSFGCLHEKWSILLLPILFLLFFVDSENENASVKIKFTTRISCGLVLFMVIGLIWVALYLGFTPVGSDYITGVQARYYLPILMLGAYICWNNKIISRMNSLVYNRIIFTGIAWLLFQCIYKLCLVPHYL